MIAAAAAWLKVGLIAGFRQSGFARLLQVDCSHHLLKNSFGLWQCVDLCCVCKCQCVCPCVCVWVRHFIHFTVTFYGFSVRFFKVTAFNNN